MAQYDRAEDLVRRLIDEQPDHAIWPRRLALLRFQVGFTELFYVGDSKAARVALEEARQTYARLVVLDPRNTEWRWQQAMVLNYLGRADLMDGRSTEALVMLEQAAAELQRLRAEDPERLGSAHQMAARVQQSLGRVHLALGDTVAGLEAFRAALALDLERAEASGDDAGPWNLVAWGQVVIGRIHQQRGELAAAQQAWRRVDEIMEPITTRSKHVEFLDTHAQALLELDEIEAARPLVEDLLANNWQDEKFLALVKNKGLGEVPNSPP